MTEYDEQQFAKSVSKLAALKAQQKELANEESLLKEEIMSMMTFIDSLSETTDFGTIRIQQRKEKDYGKSIKEAEVDLKERKKLADDLGDYEIVGIKETLVFTPLKDAF